MATAFPGPVVSAVQVGSYFVGQYYQILQQQPEFVHRYYTDMSRLIRIDGSTSETANGMVQIHSQIMSLTFTGIEIKTAHFLESWDGGVLAMVCGLVRTKEFSNRRQFVQTFFLAPQEKGYFVLNDICQFLDEEPIHQLPAAMPVHGNFESNLNESNPVSEKAADYLPVEEVQTREFSNSDPVEENDVVDKYSIPEPQQQVSEVDNWVEETPVEEPVASIPAAMNAVQDLPPAPVPPAPVEEPVVEPTKHTYASILRAAKAQSGSLVAPQTSIYRSAPMASDWKQVQQPASQQSYSAPIVAEKPSEGVEEAGAYEEEGECRSVYVRNLPPGVSVSELEQELLEFGRVRPDGVAIRNRKDAGICYAFVEFEDLVGVQNAIQGSPIQLGGRQVHIEERRPNSSSIRGGRRGRGRGGYQMEAPRGRYGGGEYANSRLRGNGYNPRGTRPDRGILGNQFSRNGHYQSEASS
ncbi:hypothetical protein QJS04_geneDACA000077 [Acorus gramineus]|uniref:G3BP-like protein n=1 Tax=Acorus gramineus TaxID=55184 RepID=A0AAV9AQ86_ACOGR|nr:hypothetical protein QJS04_geneDACA000077 [Acorus gramineus]